MRQYHKPFSMLLIIGLLCLPVLHHIPTAAASAPPDPPCVTSTITNLSVPWATPTTIPDANPTGITSTLTVSGLDTYLFDVDLTTFIAHTYNEDLDITLTSPAGTTVTITTHNGGGYDNVFAGTLWDDSASTPVTDYAFANNIVATPLQPEGALAAFTGEDPNGIWTLHLVDNMAGDTGSHSGWSLALTTLSPAPDTTSAAATQSTAIAIPDNNSTGITSTITISDQPTYLFDVDLTTFITHTFNDDLDITLTSPAGTTVTITTDNGGSHDNVFNGTLWDDSASTSVTDYAFASNGVVTPLRPEGALMDFIGEDPNGIWTLHIADDSSGDTGSLDEWSLDLMLVEEDSAAFSTANFNVTEGQTGQLELVRAGCLSQTASVQVDVSAGSATAGVDYDDTAFPVTVTFPPNVTTATVDVPAFVDGLAEGSEVVVFELTPISYAGTDSGLATLMIADPGSASAGDDTPDGGTTSTQTVTVHGDIDYIQVAVDNAYPAAGDVVTYTLTAHNPKAIPLTEVVIYDVFDYRLERPTLVSTTHGTGAVVENSLTVSGFTLQPGETATIIVSAVVSSRLQPGAVIPNMAALESPDASVHISNLVLLGHGTVSNDGAASLTQILLGAANALPNTGYPE